MDKKYCVYAHVVPKEITNYKFDKYYIGITKQENPKWRWGKNGKNYKKQIFYNAIKKYGWDNIRHVILIEDLTKEEAIEKEKEYIKKYDSLLGHKGYNVTEGGEGVRDRIVNSCEKPIYCHELKTFYRNSSIARKYTNEPSSTIKNKCIYYQKNNLYIQRKGYIYCFSDSFYKFYNTYNLNKICSASKQIVWLHNNLVYGSVNDLKKKEKIKFDRNRPLSIEKYFEYKYKKKDINNKFMHLEDYLKIYEYANIS